MGKFFGIGLSRTATTSLAKAFELLGYKSKHYPVEALYYDVDGLTKASMRGLLRIRKMLPFGRTSVFPTVIGGLFRRGEFSIDCKKLSQYDFVGDTPVTCFFDYLDRQFPGSKFILTVRDKEDWLASCGKFFLRFLCHEGFEVNKLHQQLYGSIIFDREKFSAAYDNHTQRVMAYFKARPDDLLVMNICSGEGWEKLSAFIKCPCPQIPFPRVSVPADVMPDKK
jgi:hypothetical protein